MPKLQTSTKRLIIRPMSLKDFKEWQRVYTLGEKKNRWDTSTRPLEDLTKEKYKKLLAFQKNDRDSDVFYDLGAFKKDTGELIGFVAVMNVVRGPSQSAYLGYRLFNPYWNQGFGKEMVKASYQVAFKELKLHRLEAGISPTNRRSIFLARSMGMRREGLKRRAYLMGKEWVDLVTYAITCDEAGYKFQNTKIIRRPY